jgi:RNA polymerase sigma-70 factor (sigma-E family)
MGSAESDPRDFDSFVADSMTDLHRTGYLMTNDFAETEDLLQETYLRLARRWNRVRTMEYPLAFARRVLFNLVLDGSRSRSRRRDELGEGVQPDGPVDEAATRAFEVIGDADDFRWGLARLPPQQRAVLIMRYWKDLPDTEIANVLDCSQSTVRSAASRAVVRLGQVLARRSDSEQSGDVNSNVRSIYVDGRD